MATAGTVPTGPRARASGKPRPKRRSAMGVRVLPWRPRTALMQAIDALPAWACRAAHAGWLEEVGVRTRLLSSLWGYSYHC